MSTEPDIPDRRTDRILTALAERIGARFTASSVFGAPVERDGVTVIPVAAVRLGLGGGGGGDKSAEQEGEGGGALGSATPIGYIEITDGASRFVPIVHPARIVALVCAAALAALVLLRPYR